MIFLQNRGVDPVTGKVRYALKAAANGQRYTLGVILHYPGEPLAALLLRAADAADRFESGQPPEWVDQLIR